VVNICFCSGLDTMCLYYILCCRITCTMLKNIFRNRRRSKNRPYNDENEPVTYSGSRSKAFFPDSTVDTQHKEHEMSSGQDRAQQRNVPSYQLRSSENILSATDVRHVYSNTEYINRAVSSSQVAGDGGKHNIGHPVDKRHRLSSVVMKLLRTHSESKPAPRTRRVVAADLYSPDLWTKDQSHRNGRIQASRTRHNEEADRDSVFAIPYSCKSCASTSLHGDSGKNRFRTDDSWICSHCRMQLVEARARHGSTASSPPAFVTPSIDSLGSGGSDLVYRPDTELSSNDLQLDVPVDSFHDKYNTDHNSQCDHGSSCGCCKEATHDDIYDEGKIFSAENAADFDGLPYHKNASYLPSPLHVCDLECHERQLCDDGDDDDDDDVIPELVEICSQSRSSGHRLTGDAAHFEEHSSPVVQLTAETEGQNVNESEMYILTDSFLDYSSTSFLHCASQLNCSQSAVAGHCPAQVMVAGDYHYHSKTNNGYSCNMDAAMKSVWLPVVSPRFIANDDKLYPQPDQEDETHHASRGSEEQMWCQKSLADWSTSDVLQWVVSVGLVKFYDTFHSKLLQTSLIDIVCHVN